jgi:hypothetical protein
LSPHLQVGKNKGLAQILEHFFATLFVTRQHKNSCNHTKTWKNIIADKLKTLLLKQGKFLITSMTNTNLKWEKRQT